MPTNERTLEQRRAQDALAAVRKLEEDGSYGKYVSYVKGLPAAILQNGLGQALATLLAGAKLNKRERRSEDERAREALYRHLSAWLRRDAPEAPYRKHADLMEAVIANDEDHYLRAQAEALAYLTWLKKLAVAYLREAGPQAGGKEEGG